VVLGFELKAFTLSHSTNPFLEMGFSISGLMNYFSYLALNCNPDLSLLSNYNYRHKQLASSLLRIFASMFIKEVGL
jgi:hypothetical protein